MTARWTTLLSDLALLLVAALASAHVQPSGAPVPADDNSGAVAAFAMHYAPGESTSPQTATFRAWLSQTRDDGALALVVTVSMDEEGRATGATVALAAKRAERLLAAVDERRAVEVRLLPSGGRTATVALRYD